MAAAARSTSSASLVLVEADSKLSNVEKDEVLGFVSDKGPEVASHDAVPSRPILLIEVDLDVLANVLFLLVPLNRRGSHLQRIILHLTVHAMIIHVADHLGIRPSCARVGAHLVSYKGYWG